MRRKLDSSLDVWVRSSHRKPLVLFGARGVGKSALLEALAERTRHRPLRIDFSANPQARAVFEHTSDPHEITRLLAALANERIDSARTLLILDEIQSCDDALMSLRRFKTDMPELALAAAGSSLGVHLARGSHGALPTDHVNTEMVRPLDFEEFCWAMGEAESYDIAAECAEQLRPCPLHEKMMRLYWEYLLVGGMPKVVTRYAQTRSIDAAREVQDSIRLHYVASMSEDSEGVDPAKIAATWRSLPAQLAKSTGSTKFMWKYIARGAKSERYADALDWLRDAGMVNLCTQVSGGGNGGGGAGSPGNHASSEVRLEALENPSSFKAYVADTGLLARAYGADFSDFVDPESSFGEQPANAAPGADAASAYRQAVFRMGLAENYVMQELVAAGEQPHYWGMRSKHEAQFVLGAGKGVVPVEVVPSHGKSRATAARDFARRYSSPYILQVSNRNIGSVRRDGQEIRAIPPYALSRIVA